MNRLCKVGDIIDHPSFLTVPTNDVLYITDLNNKISHCWVVVETATTGGGTGHGPHDVFPDGHQVTIKLLNYNNKGLLKGHHSIRFYQSGCFTGLIPPKEIELIEEVDLVSIGAKRQVTI